MSVTDVQLQFTKAYEAYSDAIFRYCYYRVFDREKAKDYMQEAYCRTWKYIADGKVIENIRAFIYRTANNIIIDEVRKKKSTSLDYMMEKGFAPSTDLRNKTENYFTGKEIMGIIQSLEEKYRDVVLLKYVDDLSTKEIASVLNETENNVYVRLSRGLQKVKQIVHSQEA